MKDIFENTGVRVPEVMLPSKSCDPGKWAVIACDQYTSQPEYWERVERLVGGNPSAYRVTLPEIYLKSDDVGSRISKINSTMEKYIENSVLEPQGSGFVLVDRCTPHSASRKGLVMAVDLEMYSYSAGSQSLIRATEGTVLERIPPRVKIRENALIELPHILVMIDDPGRTVIEPLFNRLEDFEKLYDFELMMGGGRIKGWKVDDEKSISEIGSALDKLADPGLFRKKYGVGSDNGVLLFAVGDGNHSLASAKAHWENVKAGLISEAGNFSCNNERKVQGSNIDIPVHQARFALVEVVNVHDEGIVFEPIHRVVFGIDREKTLDDLIHSTDGLNNTSGCQTDPAEVRKASYKLFDTKDDMQAAMNSLPASDKKTIHFIPFILEGTYGLLTVEHPSCSLEVGTLQGLLDELLGRNKELEIDYIHGEQVVDELGSKPGCLGFYLPSMDKFDFFRSVIEEGTLPRKTFSMGEAEEKRYYLECRRIR